MDRPTTLYRFFDADGRLLYIGITSAGANRWIEHEHNRAWWSQVASSTTEHYPDGASAAAAETAAIQAEQPPYNTRHRILRPAKPPRVYRPHGTGTVLRRTDRRRPRPWAVLPPPEFRGWYYFGTEEQARAFLEVTLALRDGEVRGQTERMLAKRSGG